MIRKILPLLLLVAFFVPSHAQESSFGVESPTTIEQSQDSFRPAFLKAVREARRDGKISFRQAIRLRTASFSPAFMKEAKSLAVVQIAFSGETSDAVPITEAGGIDVNGINWDGLLQFLEALLPILLQLLNAFG